MGLCPAMGRRITLVVKARHGLTSDRLMSDVFILPAAKVKQNQAVLLIPVSNRHYAQMPQKPNMNQAAPLISHSLCYNR